MNEVSSISSARRCVSENDSERAAESALQSVIFPDMIYYFFSIRTN
ncbi:MAG: hypothetical protein VX249_09530 [Pseudomonadota bacterium]|nr:hypothetical protein [Pseudomonadota bacterium]